MSEQKTEHYIGEALSGDAQKNAEKFFTYLLKSGFQFERGKGYWKDKLYWMIKYNNEYVCFVLISGEEKTEADGWVIWADDGGSDCFADFMPDQHTKGIAWKHIDVCGNCGGCKNPGGSRKMIFGKAFDNICITPMRFDNPDADTVECVKKLVECRKNSIIKNSHTQGEVQ